DGREGERENDGGGEPGERRGAAREQGGGRCGRLFGRQIEIETGVSDVTEAAARVLLQTAAQQAADGGRSLRRDGGEIWRVLDDGGQGFGNILAGVDRTAGEHLAEHDAEGPNVGALVYGLAFSLLRGHIGGGAEDHAHLGGAHG